MPLVQVVHENVDIKGSCCDSDHGHVDETEGIPCPDLDQGEGRFRLQSCAGSDIKSLVELVSKSQLKYFVRTKTRQYRYGLRDTMTIVEQSVPWQGAYLSHPKLYLPKTLKYDCYLLNVCKASLKIYRPIKIENYFAQNFLLQERFLSDATAYSKPDEESEFGYKWEIPVTFISSVNKDVSQVWMHTEQSFIEM